MEKDFFKKLWAKFIATLILSVVAIAGSSFLMVHSTADRSIRNEKEIEKLQQRNDETEKRINEQYKFIYEQLLEINQKLPKE